jgi:hypothetical protein
MIPSIKKSAKYHRKQTARANLLLGMKDFSNEYPNEVSSVLIECLTIFASREQQLQVRAALDGLLTAMPLTDSELMNELEPISTLIH